MFMFFPKLEIGDLFRINTDLGIDPNSIPYPVHCVGQGIKLGSVPKISIYSKRINHYLLMTL